MRYPTKEQRDGARAQKAGDFGLTARALAFARLYAETPGCTISAAARAAGFSDRARGAHVRGCELMRDPRVVRAILHFGALAFNKARAEAIDRLHEFTKDSESVWWPYWTRHHVKQLRHTLNNLEPYALRMERIYNRALVRDGISVKLDCQPKKAGEPRGSLR